MEEAEGAAILSAKSLPCQEDSALHMAEGDAAKLKGVISRSRAAQACARATEEASAVVRKDVISQRSQMAYA